MVGGMTWLASHYSSISLSDEAQAKEAWVSAALKRSSSQKKAPVEEAIGVLQFENAKTDSHFEWIGGVITNELNADLSRVPKLKVYVRDIIHLSPSLYISQILWERVEPHLNVGVDINAEDVARSSFLYALGESILLTEQLGLVIDILGRHEFEGLHVRVPSTGVVSGYLLDRPSSVCTAEQPCFLKRIQSFPGISARIKQNDLADFSVGVRYALGSAGSVFFGTIIPLNDDGFRPDFIPSGGIEYTF